MHRIGICGKTDFESPQPGLRWVGTLLSTLRLDAKDRVDRRPRYELEITPAS